MDRVYLCVLIESFNNVYEQTRQIYIVRLI